MSTIKELIIAVNKYVSPVNATANINIVASIVLRLQRKIRLEVVIRLLPR